MSTNPSLCLGDLIYADIENDEYLNELYSSILFNYSISLLGLKNRKKPFADSEIQDALVFADILSKSTHEKNADRHKIWGQEIVALLNSLYPNNEKIRQYLGSILVTTGNYRGLNIPSLKLGNFQLASLLDSIYADISKELLAIPADRGKHFFVHSYKYIANS